uniref:INT2 n=1 Tax=Arundo donax TaxID=35708 RepID=A0A0A9BT64_ARUDO
MPTPRPTKTRPTTSCAGPIADAITAAPAKKRKSATRIDVRRPNRSVVQPPIAAPMIAPATAMLTIIS